ncbi:MAG: LysM peptidoglycan-binding domain-containing protein [Kiritimatiellia bacterium]
MKKSVLVFMGAALAALGVSAQGNVAAREAYQQQQALAEVPRLIQQFDLLVQQQDAIISRLVKLEGTDATTDVRAEVAALRAEIAELRASIRREQDAMRAEIVRDLAGRISRMTPPAAAPAPVVAPSRASSARPVPPPAPVGPHYEYGGEKGQTLALIAKGFDTTVPKILAMNPGLKPNQLRVGQKLRIPVEEQPKAAHQGKRGRK